MKSKIFMAFNLADMDKEGLFELGQIIGETSKERPDITHEFLLGFREGLNKTQEAMGYGMGNVFERLWHRAHHALQGKFSIPFRSLHDAPSGEIKIKK